MRFRNTLMVLISLGAAAALQGCSAMMVGSDTGADQFVAETADGGRADALDGAPDVTTGPDVVLGDRQVADVVADAAADVPADMRMDILADAAADVPVVDVPLAVIATRPINGAINVWPGPGQQVAAVFNQPMDPTTLTTSTFTLAQGATMVTGLVSYDPPSRTATFAPAAILGSSLLYTATISTSVRSASGRGLAVAYTWSFTTRAAPIMTLPVNLLSAGNYVILAETQISTVPTSAITGDIAVSPAAATFITGFSLVADSTNVFSRSTQVTGRVYAANYMPPTPSNLTTATTDMTTAFTDAAGRAPDVTELGAGNVAGMTLAPGVYRWGTGLLIPTNLHLAGSATDVWIFQIAQNLTMSSAVRILLNGGALARNVFWQVSGLVDIGTTAHFEGVILCRTAITMRTGASINGRLLAQSAVSIDSSTIVDPGR